MNNLPVTIFNNKKIITTKDGSFSFYSIEYNESYKTKSVGAYTESLHKFINGSSIINKLQNQDIRVLDICFGIGMNLATTIDQVIKSNIKNKLHLVSVEKDYHLIQLVNSLEILSPYSGYRTLKKLLKYKKHNNISLELYLMDATKFINILTGKFDIIYFDPFSKKHNHEMWSANIFEKLYKLLNYNGCLVTYASSKSIKEIMINTKFKLQKHSSIGKRFQPSIVATK